jgi:hypothetical protein
MLSQSRYGTEDLIIVVSDHRWGDHLGYPAIDFHRPSA